MPCDGLNWDHVRFESWRLAQAGAVESTFATVRLRTKVTTGRGSRAAGLAMAYKLVEAAQLGWRAVNAPHLVKLVRDCVAFDKGKPVEHKTELCITEDAA